MLTVVEKIRCPACGHLVRRKRGSIISNHNVGDTRKRCVGSGDVGFPAPPKAKP